jgi:hypothetical protein
MLGCVVERFFDREWFGFVGWSGGVESNIRLINLY